VPMYDIDLIWHTHQLHPESYKQDMIKNLNHILNHDDSIQEHKINSKLYTSDHETRVKWYELYGEKLPKNGCMYRGKTSKNVYTQVTDFTFLRVCQRYLIYVQFSTVLSNETSSSSSSSSSKSTKSSLEIDNVNTVVSSSDSLQSQFSSEQIFVQINSSNQELFTRSSSGLIEAHFEADYFDLKTNFKLKIQRRAGYWPLNYYASIQEYVIDEPIKIMQSNDIVEPSDMTNISDNSTALFHLFETNIENDSKIQQLIPNAKRLILGIPTIEINTIIVVF
ncbi:unnamed protein product, partial [Didymodactylos carnosus]